jgi:hypothetical protein
MNILMYIKTSLNDAVSALFPELVTDKPTCMQCDHIGNKEHMVPVSGAYVHPGCEKQWVEANVW